MKPARNDFWPIRPGSCATRWRRIAAGWTRMPNRIADTLREHEAIMQAILAHDPERAYSTMRDHVNLLGDNLLDFLAAFK